MLDHLKKLPSKDLSIAALARKVSTILALASFLRVSELDSIGQVSFSPSNSCLSFSLSAPRKAQKDGNLQRLTLTSLPDPLINPVDCVYCYLTATAIHRNATNADRLFIGSVKPHKPVTGSTIAGWIKRQLAEAGVDTSKFSAHSTRRSAASKAASLGATIASILGAAHWASESTLTRFYRKNVAARQPLEGIVLDTLSPNSIIYLPFRFKVHSSGRTRFVNNCELI